MKLVYETFRYTEQLRGFYELFAVSCFSINCNKFVLLILYFELILDRIYVKLPTVSEERIAISNPLRMDSVAIIPIRALQKKRILWRRGSVIPENT